MTVSLKHTFASAKPDSADATIIQPSNWNQEHDLTLATNKVLGRATAGTGAAEELSVGTALSVSGGTLTVTNVPVANGGTGAATLTGYVKGNGTSAFTAAATVPVGDISGTLPAANGGTGLSSPGTAGNLLVSTGTGWTSTPPIASGGSFDAVASGTLASGSTVIVNVDGTVSVVAGAAQSVTSPTTFSSTTSLNATATYDSVLQKVIVIYSDSGNSSFPTAVVGTVSGSTITFGTPVVLSTFSATLTGCAYDPIQQRVLFGYFVGSIDEVLLRVATVSGTTLINLGTETQLDSSTGSTFSMVYVPTSQKIAVAFTDIPANGTFGFAKIVTLTGSTISLGGIVTFRSGSTTVGSIVYDAASDRVVICYINNIASSAGEAIVGQVSGTSVTFGGGANFNATLASFVKAAYDANAQKVVVAYRDGSNSNYGTVIVGTVSGTTITFGVKTVFQSSTTTVGAVAYDTSAQKVVINYINAGSGNAGTALAGIVSGTSISFVSPIVFASGGTTTLSSVYAANAQKVVFVYNSTANSNFGTAVLYQTPTTNMTAENFIGFSSAAYTNGQTATIQIVSAVNSAQSGLTPGQSYFVQGTGALGLAADNPSVFAGTAVAANKIIVKG